MISSNQDNLNRHQKRMIELLKAPKAIRFQEFEAILNACGYYLAHSRGSHFKFKKPNSLTIMAVVHHNMVAKIYIKKAFKLLLFYL